MIEKGPKYEQIDNRRMEHEKLQGLQRPEPELLSHAGDGIVRLLKMEVDLGDVLSDDLDLVGATHAQALFMRDADPFDTRQADESVGVAQHLLSVCFYDGKGCIGNEAVCP